MKPISGLENENETATLFCQTLSDPTTRVWGFAVFLCLYIITSQVSVYFMLLARNWKTSDIV